MGPALGRTLMTVEEFLAQDARAELIRAHRGQHLRPEPFEALEFSVDELLGDDPADD
jgi:hypothetical protein